MKNLFFILLIPFVFSSKVFSQTSSWEWQNPKPSGSWLSSSHFFDAQNGLAVGSDGAIHKTSDGGQNWATQYSGTKNSLGKVFFINSQIGWAIGMNGTLIKTSNSGTNWVLLPTGTQDLLTDIHFIDPLKGWMAGHDWTAVNSGKIWQTTDGGISWTLLNLGVELNEIKSIFFSDGQNGLVLGNSSSNSFCLKTSNGGSNWIQSQIPNNGNVADAQFLNIDLGWAVSGQKILKYNNGVWSQVGSDLSVGNYFIYFKNPNTGWISGSGGIILKTTDSGMTWNTQNSNIGLGLFSFYFIDGQTGWAFGEAGATLKTTNGGTDWINQVEHIKVNFKKVSFSNSQKGIAVGTNGTIFSTSNGGSNWIPQTSGSNKDLSGIFLGFNNKACAVGKEGTILLSQNAGSSWTSLTSPVSENLIDVAFANESKGFAIGEGGTILTSTNSGSNWSTLQNFSFGLKDIFILNEQKIWIIGAQGEIVHSGNAGGSWQQISQIPNGFDGNLSFIDEQNGWATCQASKIFKTTNGGNTWTEIELDENILVGIALMNGCHFFDSQTGIVYGEITNGGIMTTDGGNSWFFLDLPLLYGEIHMTFANNQIGYTVGSNGAILKTSSGGRPLSNKTLVSEASFSVFPNPAKTFVQLKSEEPITKVELINNKGQSVEFTLLEDKKMDLKNLASGIYFLKIQTTKGLKTQKIVRE